MLDKIQVIVEYNLLWTLIYNVLILGEMGWIVKKWGVLISF